MIYVNSLGYVDGEIISGHDYYMEIVRPTLFSKGYAKVCKYAHPNSMSDNQLLYKEDYDQLEDVRWEYERYSDPINTAWGTF
jgi:hypothetical protein